VAIGRRADQGGRLVTIDCRLCGGRERAKSRSLRELLCHVENFPSRLTKWLENKYSNIAFMKDGLANLRRTAAARLIPKPPEKGSGIRYRQIRFL
jgi:hypothetical protein